MHITKRLTETLLGLLVTRSCCEAANVTEDWWREPFGMFQTNLRDIDANVDVDQVADYIKQYGAVAWLQSVGGIVANYPSKFDFHATNPFLNQRQSGDLVQDSLDAARARGIRLLARMDFSKVQKSIAEAHPEWLYVSPNGTWQTHPHDTVSVCPSGKWYQERVFDILDEVMTLYDVGGFFVNWAGFNEQDYFRVYHGVCHCQSCQARWQNYSGSEPLPDGKSSPGYAKWKVFSDGIIAEWTKNVRVFIAKRKPDAALILGEAADIMFYEANNAVDRDIWHHATSETASKFVSYRPDVPVLINACSHIDHAYRIAAENTNHFAQYHLQAMSRGANPSTYIIGIPGQIPWPGLNQTAELVRFHRDWKDVYTGLKPASKTGLVLPQSSQMNATQYERSLSEYQGLYKSLQELHVPFDVIAQQYIAGTAKNGGLARYEMIVLPNLGKLKAVDAENLDNWAAAGGTLVATGAIGVESNGTLQLKSLPASRQRDFLTEDEEMWSTYLAPEQNHTAENYYEGPLIPILGSYGVYEWKEGSRGRYKKLAYAPFAPMEYVYGNVQVDERGVGVGAFENGTGILATFPVGRGYREMGLSMFRDFFEIIVGEAGANKGLHFNLAPQVEVTLNSNGLQTVIHLINLSGIRKQNFGKYLPIPAGSITVPGGDDGVTARSLAGNLTLDVKDGEIKLPGLGLFDVVVIDGLY